MNKKVGIITFHRSHNCGSILESFAMQKIVSKLGYSAELINFSSNGQRDMYRVFSKQRKIKKIIKNIIVLPLFRTIRRHYNNYADFIKKHLKVSSGDYKTESDLKNIKDNYDIFLAGSDQIWNITIPDYDISYFLPFTEKKKIAYAPSFGAKNILDNSASPEIYCDLLKKFNYLSVRENNGKKWIYDMTGISVPVVLDPTLLIGREEYDKLERDSGIKGKYIFYYSPQYKKDINKFVKRVSKKYKMPVIVWNSKEYIIKGLYRYGFKMAYEQDPGIYLNLIKHAELVITTSFHGSIFSSIYRKKFWVMKNGGMYGDDDRVLTLLDELKLSDRLIEPTFDESCDYMEREIDYSSYKTALIKHKKESIDFLEEALEK
ncbi:MAG: polysaccharide pyruvyl transferase family protein [Candidatus Saccharibacteria bacterium]|nr:polysaccharide pyruvyl transferase family protein [Candidatus Saccharibacteria bacterium]